MQNEQKHKEGVVDSLLCPSFSTYSSNKLADIADRVTQNDNAFDANDDLHQNDNDFEFVAFRKAADEVFFDGHVGAVFPIFNRDILTVREGSGEEEDAAALQFPMEKLLIGDKDYRRSHRDPPSSSSSEVDDLEAIPAGTYCVWTPNSVHASPSRCKKSNSTGSSSSSSKRWKLLDLLRRSNSDGKDSFVFMTPSSPSSSGINSAKKKGAKAENSKVKCGSGNGSNEATAEGFAGKKIPAKSTAVTGGEKKVSAHEALYVRNRELMRANKRRSFLPYRQDLVGFCASLNGMGRTFPPF